MHATRCNSAFCAIGHVSTALLWILHLVLPLFARQARGLLWVPRIGTQDRTFVADLETNKMHTYSYIYLFHLGLMALGAMLSSSGLVIVEWILVSTIGIHYPSMDIHPWISMREYPLMDILARIWRLGSPPFDVRVGV